MISNANPVDSARHPDRRFATAVMRSFWLGFETWLAKQAAAALHVSALKAEGAWAGGEA